MYRFYVQTQFRSLCAFFLSRSLVTPRHRCVIMNKVVNESRRKICHYQQNVPQHYYLLDTLVHDKFNIFSEGMIINNTVEISFDRLNYHIVDTATF